MRRPFKESGFLFNQTIDLYLTNGLKLIWVGELNRPYHPGRGSSHFGHGPFRSVSQPLSAHFA